VRAGQLALQWSFVEIGRQDLVRHDADLAQ
jgi:hypothetical protein